MARPLRPVGLDFIEDAPVRLTFTARTAAGPEAVYRALAEDVEGWPRWFGAVTMARPTHGGAGREVRLVGGTRFQETIMAAEPKCRYAYRVDETNAPGVRALLEEWRLRPAGPGTGRGTGTLVRWTFAADGPALFRLALAGARPGLGHSFRSAVRALDTRLSAHRPAGQ
ncbi:MULTISPECIES: SRPBCC family protein [unclassified Streptomyces]|uniref:SRPBCC family protein n=1 Tax=unclassified Streptomyces TaxID=2593676 RepID=UPI002E0E1988|nr:MULTISPECIES: SRPBCC family protein [unclassified Streptomyces]WSR24636.1 SRPBCC family protein [Streptomyces sp. NBC_01205]